ncbi:hypothetical protein E2C01_082698 [Portunus trituberculatus]|uniref:Uncharacterized protein n=1 Tax=Portunus trituberculatus TaxID=210409 RepID=A0A5B7IQL8_PORTR|nr:hypothetical protein [Portunus trituberculatus]
MLCCLSTPHFLPHLCNLNRPHHFHHCNLPHLTTNPPLPATPHGLHSKTQTFDLHLTTKIPLTATLQTLQTHKIFHQSTLKKDTT